MLTPKEQKTLARLESDLKMPTWKYLLIYGLTFGILFAIFTVAIDVLLHGVTLAEVLKKRLWINLAMSPVTGLFYGYILRWFSIKQYQKLKAKERLP